MALFNSFAGTGTELAANFDFPNYLSLVTVFLSILSSQFMAVMVVVPKLHSWSRPSAMFFFFFYQRPFLLLWYFSIYSLV